MRNMLTIIKQRLEAGQDLVLVTIIAASGATPRGAGARMLVGREGCICGTIGGGIVEYRSVQIAQQVLEQKRSYGHDFTLTQEDIQNLGMICGGSCRVFFHYLPAADPAVTALAETAALRFREDKDLWLVCDMASGGTLTLTGKQDPHLAPYLKRRPSRLLEHGRDLYIEQIHSASRVYVFGGGHVAQELVPVLAHVGFRCTVLEERAEFADPALFPDAEQVLLADFSRISDFVSIGSEDYVCVMTRGHASDTLIQAQVLRCGPCYCGVIGSRSKAAAVRRALKEDFHLTDAELDRITTPIGLPILSETPAEVAISIAAQMILVRGERSRL